MVMANLSELSAVDIIAEMQLAHDVAFRQDTLDDFFENEYGQFFKALAQKTQGSLLWNENQADMLLENELDDEQIQKIIALNKKQVSILTELGMIDEADHWETYFNDSLDEMKMVMA